MKTKFKQTEIGEIPEDWKLDLLGNYCDVKGGKRLPKGENLVNYKTSHPYIRIKDITQNGIEKSNLMFLTDSTYSKISKYIINKGDVYLSIVGTIGLSGVIDDELDGANLTENAARLFNFKNLNSIFLYYFLKSSTGQEQIYSKTVGSTQSKLALFRIKDIKFPALSIDEQQQITSILSSLDDKIALNQKINKTLDEIGKALFKRWFVDFEFPNENGKPYKSSGGKMIDSELGKIPEEWKVEKLKNLIKITSGKRPKVKVENKTENCNIPIIGASGVMGYTSAVLYDERIIVTGRVGTLGVVQKIDYPCWMSDNSLVIQSEYYEYLYEILFSMDFSTLNVGSTQPLITQTTIKDLDIVIPKKLLLQKFEFMTENLTLQVKSNKEETELLKNIRDSLLPRLMIGKLRVN